MASLARIGCIHYANSNHPSRRILCSAKPSTTGIQPASSSGAPTNSPTISATAPEEITMLKTLKAAIQSPSGGETRLTICLSPPFEAMPSSPMYNFSYSRPTLRARMFLPRLKWDRLSNKQALGELLHQFKETSISDYLSRKEPTFPLLWSHILNITSTPIALLGFAKIKTEENASV